MAAPVPRAVRIGKPLLFLAALAPFVLLLARIFQDDLGPNPVETLNRYTGDWTLRFLLFTLAVTPLRQLTGWHLLIRFRRMLGLFAFFYACLHFLSWIWIDKVFEWEEIVRDVYKRPFITLGFASFVLLVPLAVTSTNAMVRRLGGRRWRALHRVVYVIAVGGVVHFLWQVKSDIAEPALYALILAALLGYRLWAYRRSPAFGPVL
ncbi:sulfite oxidase [Sulfurifustis variabilis]|uniref:Protein-methionine-sulfoxide reductase heme-binding subunit MsrQ n=1 Tax=Sulfurifustis variabilis TaxID=1675686 RepID=A0A1B4VCZ9_9GAMM|nr:protein-methionine-sulfoxide reductase heme-binding subunit MsrQ [Sulfurifustis variabilis]BAU47137.1 sulfite oxidase [Sulfurifustis variabilis]